MKADFLANENVERFLDLLRRPHLTSEKRTTLQNLLVEEEDKLSRDRERLELSERRVREGKERIARLRTAVANRTLIDPNRDRDLSLLTTMEQTQGLLERYSFNLRVEIFPYCVMLQATVVAICTAFDEASQRAQQFANANPKNTVTIIDRSNGDSHLIRPE